MATMDDVRLAARELERGELHERSVLYSLWASIFSIQSSLELNARKYHALLSVLRSDGGLPARATIRRALEGCGMVYDTQIDALYWAEYLHQSGKLRGLENIGQTRGAQENWRAYLLGLWHDGRGHGMAEKTISMAALLLHPTSCELVPVDRHVLAYTGTRRPRSYERYLEIEAIIDDSITDDVPLAWKHWLRWENWRQATGASRVTVGAESHAALSVRK